MNGGSAATVGGNVTNWKDSSGNNANAVGDSPILRAGGYGGRNCIEFDGAGGFSVSSMLFSVPFRVWAVVKVSSGADMLYELSDDAGASNGLSRNHDGITAHDDNN